MLTTPSFPDDARRVLSDLNATVLTQLMCPVSETNRLSGREVTAEISRLRSQPDNQDLGQILVV